MKSKLLYVGMKAWSVPDNGVIAHIQQWLCIFHSNKDELGVTFQTFKPNFDHLFE